MRASYMSLSVDTANNPPWGYSFPGLVIQNILEYRKKFFSPLFATLQSWRMRLQAAGLISLYSCIMTIKKISDFRSPDAA